MRKTILLTVLTLISQIGFAQVQTNDPYSSYGLGESGGMDHASFLGLGNSTITFFDSTVINFYNPASYNTLAKGQPLFSFGISSRLSTFSEGSNNHFSNTTGIQHFALAFPVMIKKHRAGLAFGLKPYSRRGYEFSSGDLVGSDSIYYNYSGEGGIHEFFVGLSTDILNFKKSRLAVGANLGYLFGESTNIRKSHLSGTNDGGVNTKILDIGSFHYEFGAYFTQSFGNHSVTLSSTLEPSQGLNGKFEDGLFFSTDIDDPSFYDTLSYSSVRSELFNAANYNFGLSYRLTLPSDDERGRRLNTELAFHGNYTMTDWDAFSDPFDQNGTEYLNTSKLSFGVQYSPETKIIEKRTLTKFHERMRYRAGYYSYSLPFMSGSEQVNDQGATFGIGIPIIIQRSLSSVNFGFSYGSRGTSDPQLLREKYYGINLGITIAPGSSERWFRKPKLN
jgi:hypothetical protein